MFLNYSRLGNNTTYKPVIVLHGLFGSKENLNVIARPLSETHTVINIDLRNHGASFHSDTMNYSLMANDVITLMNHLQIEQFSVVGHSMGGKVAMQLALLFGKRIEKLVVLDIAPTQYQPRHQAIFTGLKNVTINSLQNRSQADTQLSEYIIEPSVRQFLLKSLTRTEQGFNWRFNLEHIIDSYDRILAKPEGVPFSNPTLFIKGERSDYIQEQYRKEIASLFPTATAKIIAGAGHWLHAEKPTQVNLAISQFMAH